MAIRRYANLAATVAGELQQDARIVRDDVRIIGLVHEGDDGGVPRGCGQCRGEVVHAAPDVVDTGEIKRLTARQW